MPQAVNSTIIIQHRNIIDLNKILTFSTIDLKERKKERVEKGSNNNIFQLRGCHKESSSSGCLFNR